MKLRCVSDTPLNLAAMEVTLMHPKGLSTPQKAKLCRMSKMPWIKVLWTVWWSRNPDSGPQAGPALLTHSSSRAGDSHGSMTKILSPQCSIARPIHFVEKKPRFHSTKYLSQCSKLLRKQSVHSHKDGWCVEDRYFALDRSGRTSSCVRQIHWKSHFLSHLRETHQAPRNSDCMFLWDTTSKDCWSTPACGFAFGLIFSLIYVLLRLGERLTHHLASLP